MGLELFYPQTGSRLITGEEAKMLIEIDGRGDYHLPEPEKETLEV